LVTAISSSRASTRPVATPPHRLPPDGRAHHPPRPPGGTSSRASSASDRMRLDFLCEAEDKPINPPRRRLDVSDLLITPQDLGIPASWRQEHPTNHKGARFSPYHPSTRRGASASACNLPTLGEERPNPHRYASGEQQSSGYSTPGPPPSVSASESSASTTHDSLDLPTAVPRPWLMHSSTPTASTSSDGHDQASLYYQAIPVRSPRRAGERSYRSVSPASTVDESFSDRCSDAYASEPC
jgi:hypothetical protein